MAAQSRAGLDAQILSARGRQRRPAADRDRRCSPCTSSPPSGSSCSTSSRSRRSGTTSCSATSSRPCRTTSARSPPGARSIGAKASATRAAGGIRRRPHPRRRRPGGPGHGLAGRADRRHRGAPRRRTSRATCGCPTRRCPICAGATTFRRRADLMSVVPFSRRPELRRRAARSAARAGPRALRTTIRSWLWPKAGAPRPRRLDRSL